MPNLMQRGVSMFGRKALAAAGRTVTFVRGSTTHELTAWITEGMYQIQDASGVPVQITTRDYKFQTADLPLKLRVGDRFREVVNGETHVVEVMPLGEDPGTSWVDSDGTLTVAHCKMVKLEV